jgi:N-acetylmuramoyl-L-alanine amidase
MSRLRDLVAIKLRAYGHTVLTDGTPGVNLPLVQAIALVPLSDVAIELHTNGFDNPAARGVEVVANESKQRLAQQLAGSIAAVIGSPLRGKRGWIPQQATPRGKLGFVRAGGLVVETFFLSNRADLDAYLGNYWRVAQAIADTLHAQSK